MTSTATQWAMDTIDAARSKGTFTLSVMAAVELLWDLDEPACDCGCNDTWSALVRRTEIGGFVTKSE